MPHLTPNGNNFVYYKITESRQEYKGERYFRHKPSEDTIIQVMIHPGEGRKGKSNTFGVYLITRSTFFSNYLAMQYAVPCEKEEYEKNFKKVLSYLI